MCLTNNVTFFILDLFLYRERGIPVVREEWLSDSIEKQEPQPLDAYDIVSDLAVDGKGIPWDKQDPSKEALESIAAEVHTLLIQNPKPHIFYVSFIISNFVSVGRLSFYLKSSDHLVLWNPGKGIWKERSTQRHQVTRARREDSRKRWTIVQLCLFSMRFGKTSE